MSKSDRIYPYLFHPVYKDYIWGGSKIRDTFHRTDTPHRCAESWEITDRPEGMSIVANGACKGIPLQKLVQELQGDLLGPQYSQAQVFPLLIKLIDAHQNLSVQVHPSDDNAHRTGGEPKSEMWYILEANTNATVYTGMQPGATAAVFQEALHCGTLADLLTKVPAKAGRTVFLPGGKVHAIGAGCLMLEIQQNSNTTYRVFDWNRLDAEGKPRELHIEQALQVIDWDRQQPEVSTPRPMKPDGKNHPFEILEKKHFTTIGWSLQEPRIFEMNPVGFRIIFVSKGKVLIGANGFVASASLGTTCLIPAAAERFTLTPVDGKASVVEIRGAS